MAVRATMAALIARERILINDVLAPGAGQIFSDQTIQDVLDESRVDVFNMALVPKVTYSGSTIQWLDYESDYGGWEDGYTIKQFLTVLVTPSLLEPIVGHWSFAASTLPPLYITGSLHDVYRAAADLLERWAAIWVLSYSVNLDGQSMQLAQAANALQKLAKTYRMKQRPGSLVFARGDLATSAARVPGLGATEIDYMASG